MPCCGRTRASEPSPHFGRPIVKRMVAQTLVEARSAAERGIEPPSDDELLAHAIGLASKVATGLTSVINATGVVLHTNLGRAPLPEAAARPPPEPPGPTRTWRSTARREARQALDARRGAADRADRSRGRARREQLRRRAPALLAALARRKEVLVSRGELIEIGGEFRIPDIMAAASGAKLVEVGTTNRTRTADYRAAITRSDRRDPQGASQQLPRGRVHGVAAGARTSRSLAAKRGVPFTLRRGLGSAASRAEHAA